MIFKNLDITKHTEVGKSLILPCYWRRNIKGCCSSSELWVKDIFDVTTAILRDSLSSLWSSVFSWPPGSAALSAVRLSLRGCSRQQVWPCRVQGCPSVLRRGGAMSPGILGKGSLSLSEHLRGGAPSYSILTLNIDSSFSVTGVYNNHSWDYGKGIWDGA